MALFGGVLACHWLRLTDTGNHTMEKQLLTNKELAQVLGCSWRHVMTLKDKRLIPYVQLGRLVRYNAQDVLKALGKLTVKEHAGAKPLAAR